MQTGGSKTRSILVFCTVLGVTVSGAVLLAMTALQDSPECATHQAMDRSMPLQSRLQSIIDSSADQVERIVGIEKPDQPGRVCRASHDNTPLRERE